MRLIREAGGECELVDWHGQPLAIGEIRASVNPDSSPTVLCYGHFDVQPPDPLELWDSDPFEPAIRGEYLYCRGAVDDKGQLFMLLAAARDWRSPASCRSTFASAATAKRKPAATRSSSSSKRTSVAPTRRSSSTAA